MSIELIKLNKDHLKGTKPSLMPTQNTWICGGAIRQWFMGNEDKSDIDVFGTSVESLNKFIEVKLEGCKLVSENKFTKTFSFHGQFVQVMVGRPFPTLENALDNFDFNVCQFGFDGTDVFSTVDSMLSCLRGHLGVHRIFPEFAADSLRRAFKYQAKGYVPCAGTMRGIGQAFVGLTKEQIAAQVEISPNGGARTVGID